MKCQNFFLKIYIKRMIRDRKHTLLTIIGLVLSVIIINMTFILTESILKKQLMGYEIYKKENIILLQGISKWEIVDCIAQNMLVNIKYEIWKEEGNIAGTDIIVNKILLDKEDNFYNLPLNIEEKTRYYSKLLYSQTLEAKDINDKSIIIDEYLSQIVFGTKNSVGKKIYITTNTIDNDIHMETIAVQGYSAYTIAGIVKGSEEDKKGYKQFKENQDITRIFNVYIPCKGDIIASDTENLQVFLQSSEFTYQELSDKIYSILYDYNWKEEYEIWNYDSLIFSIMDMLRLYKNALYKINIGLVVINSLYIMTIVLFSIKERVSEIGIRKSLGATNIDIIEQFVFEGLCYGIISGIVGGIIVAFISMTLTMLDICKLYQEIQIYIDTLAIAIITGVFSSVIPAYYASNIKIVEAMKFE